MKLWIGGMMTDHNIIDIVVAELTKYPSVKFQKGKNDELKIYRNDEYGIDIILQTDVRENTLHFGSFHWHYENTEEEIDEMLSQLIFALVGLVRIQEFSKNGIAYKWTLQIKDSDGNWHDNGTMQTINLKFWTTPDISYLQNSILPESIVK